MNADEAAEILRSYRSNRVKDWLINAITLPTALLIALSILLGGVYLFDHWANYEEREHERKLLECFKDARIKHTLIFCQAHWGPDKDDK